MGTRDLTASVDVGAAQEFPVGDTSPPRQMPPDLMTAVVDVIYALRLQPTLGFEYISPSVEALVGYAPADFYADPELALRTVGPQGEAAFRDAVRGPAGRHLDLLLPAHRRDGSSVWTQHRCTRVERGDGSVVLYGSARDASAQVRLVADLTESERRFRLLAENASDMVLQIRPGGEIDWASPSVRHLLGWEEHGVPQPATWELVHPDDMWRVEGAVRGLRAPDDQVTVQFRMRRSDASYLWVSAKLRHAEDNCIVAGIRDVDEDVRGRQQLMDDRQRFQMIASGAADVVFEIDLAGRIVWVSPHVESTLGWTARELDGSRLADLVVVPQPPTPVGEERRRSRTRDAWPVRQWLTKDGDRVWMSSHSEALTNEHGEQVGTIVGLRDVDALMWMRDSAQAREGRLRTLVDAFIDPHMLLRALRDADGSVVDFDIADVNDAVCRHTGTPRTRLLGARLLEQLPRLRGTEMFEHFRTALQTGEPLILDDARYPHGVMEADRLYDMRVVKVDDSDLISFTWRDVTERHRIMEELRASEEANRLLVQNVTDVVVHVRAGEIAAVSRSLTEALGWRVDEWIGHNVDAFVPAGDMPALVAARHRIEAGETRSLRLQIRAKDGTLHWIAVRARPFMDSQGHEDGSSVAFHVIDDQVAIEAELDRRAHLDDLTGLLNRNEALSRMKALVARRRRAGDAVAVLYVDVDAFKSVNDTYGHAAGDEVLRVTGRRLREVVRGGDIVARMGGDEFLVILANVHQVDEAMAVAEKIRSAAALPIDIGAERLRVTVSVGVTVTNDEKSTESAVNRADSALYAAKAAGRDRVVGVPSTSA